jgi:hypothetical protein
MLPKKGKKLHDSGRGGGSELDFCSLIAVALRTELGSNHQAAKTIMRWTGASERTVKHFRSAIGAGDPERAAVPRD